MFDQIWNSVGANPWLIGIATIGFFTIKGLMWLALPAFLIRFKHFFLPTARVPNRKQLQDW